MVFRNIEYVIIRSNRKTLALEVKRGGEVIVRAPLRMTEQKIVEFLNLRYNWLIKAVERQKIRKDNYDIPPEKILELKQKAEEVLPRRVEYFSKIMNLYPQTVKINLAKTRFGSCSGKNNINFSAFLMMFPIEAIDYVVVHELAQIKYKNHQKEFYDFVKLYMPDYKKRAALLKM